MIYIGHKQQGVTFGKEYFTMETTMNGKKHYIIRSDYSLSKINAFIDYPIELFIDCYSNKNVDAWRLFITKDEYRQIRINKILSK